MSLSCHNVAQNVTTPITITQSCALVVFKFPQTAQSGIINVAILNKHNNIVNILFLSEKHSSLTVTGTSNTLTVSTTYNYGVEVNILEFV